MNMDSLRSEIENVDEKLAELFKKRMDLARQVGEYKKENNLPVFDSGRERFLLDKNTEGMDGDMSLYGRIFFKTLMDLSRSRQHGILNSGSEIAEKINNAIKNTPALFPEKARVACQGTEGAYSQAAAERMFVQPSIMYFKTFEGVISAVNAGLCEYGMLPIENSTAGSVNKIYDLISKYDINIVRALKLKVDHSLIANKGAVLSGIKEIYSHEQAINQCSEFLKELDVRAIPCENTAAAAKMVAESGRNDIAALASPACAKLYGLLTLKEAAQDRDNNYTRFICISGKTEIYPGADKTSLMFTLPHKSGSLNNAISRFSALGVNLTKLESRPIPDRNFEFMFYFDLECPVYSPVLPRLIAEIEGCSETFKYLGTYSEVL